MSLDGGSDVRRFTAGISVAAEVMLLFSTVGTDTQKTQIVQNLRIDLIQRSEIVFFGLINLHASYFFDIRLSSTTRLVTRTKYLSVIVVMSLARYLMQ